MGGFLFVCRQSLKGLLGPRRNSLTDAAYFIIGFMRQLVSVPLVPEFGEQEFKKRQGARFCSHVIEYPVDEPLLEPKSNLFGRLFNGAAEFLRGHRANV